jgi:insulysin
MQAIRDPLDHDLRSKQQAGHVVVVKAKEIDEKLYNVFVIQSSSHDGRDLLACFEFFLEQFLASLNNGSFSLEMFDRIKDSLINNLKMNPKSPQEMGALLNDFAFSQNGNFRWNLEKIAALEGITFEQFRTIANEMLAKTNRQRLSIISTGNPSDELLKYRKITSLKQLKGT